MEAFMLTTSSKEIKNDRGTSAENIGAGATAASMLIAVKTAGFVLNPVVAFAVVSATTAINYRYPEATRRFVEIGGSAIKYFKRGKRIVDQIDASLAQENKQEQKNKMSGDSKPEEKPSTTKAEESKLASVRVEAVKASPIEVQAPKKNSDNPAATLPLAPRKNNGFLSFFNCRRYRLVIVDDEPQEDLIQKPAARL